jgi:iron complex transport system ATP-binding protein
MVLPDLNEAARVSHHIVSVKVGEVIGAGRPDEVIRPDLLGKLFGADCDVYILPDTGWHCCVSRSKHTASTESRAAAEAVFEVGELRTGHGKISVLRG